MLSEFSFKILGLLLSLRKSGEIIVYVRFCFAILVATLVSACDPARDRAFRIDGAGLDLHNSLTDKTTANLKRYFESLCTQAGYASNTCVPAPADSSEAIWSLLVETGYNDIDVRCDQYLTWIDEKRSQRIFVEGSSTALGALLGGVLGVAGAGAPTIAYTALALGFTRSVYDSYNSSILIGLEGSTIKEIVNRQRVEHRTRFAKSKYQTRPQAVFALRRYLTFCTPQSILTDVNVFSRDAASGRATRVKDNAVVAAAIIPGPDDPALPPGRGDVETPENVALIFEGPNFSETDVRTVQIGACITDDGKVGDDTKAAVQIIEQTLGDGSDGNGKLKDTEWAQVEADLLAGCPANLRNFFEVATYGRGTEDRPGAGLVALLTSQNLISSALKGKDLSDPEVRSALAKLRSDKGVKESYTGYDVSQQVTPALLEAVGLK